MKNQNPSLITAELYELRKLEDNKNCAECNAMSPQWASWTLGVFLCMRCAGLHRGLGVNISRVKAVTLDEWTREQVDSMKIKGNKVARSYFEAGLPAHFNRPKYNNDILKFIREKYENKKYVKSSLPYEEFSKNTVRSDFNLSLNNVSPSSDVNRNQSSHFNANGKSEPTKPTSSNDIDDIFGQAPHTGPQTMSPNLIPFDLFSIPSIQTTAPAHISPIQTKPRNNYDNLTDLFSNDFVSPIKSTQSSENIFNSFFMPNNSPQVNSQTPLQYPFDFNQYPNASVQPQNSPSHLNKPVEFPFMSKDMNYINNSSSQGDNVFNSSQSDPFACLNQFKSAEDVGINKNML